LLAGPPVCPWRGSGDDQRRHRPPYYDAAQRERVEELGSQLKTARGTVQIKLSKKSALYAIQQNNRP
jgi:hypothetical protein